MNQSDMSLHDDDVQITKVIPVQAKKAMTSWVAPSFGSSGFEAPVGQKHGSFSSSKTGGLKQPVSLPQWKRNPPGSQSSIKDIFSSEPISRKRARESSMIVSSRKTLIQLPQTFELWPDKYTPNSRAELAVHKKKVEEISEWFEKINSPSGKTVSAAPILLLMGPPGAGKSACVKAVCNDLGWNLQEWVGTSEQAADQWTKTEDRTERSSVDAYQSQSQSSTFHNFLLRANKYQALDILGGDGYSASCGRSKRSVIVVEEMPNIFYRDTSQFHDILRKYKHGGRSPLVFIMSESNNNSSNIQKLFPKDLQHQLSISTISMNPVAPTMLVKLLTRVANLEAAKSRYVAPTASVIESIAMSSGGDIRSALNTLQFACGKDTLDLKVLSPAQVKPCLKKQTSKTSSRGRLKYGSSSSKTNPGVDSDNKDGNSSLGLKDKAVFLFQSVGKILHFKRGDPKDFPPCPGLPNHLNQHDRDPLQVDPEEVAFKSQLSGDFLTSFLHENYVEFLSTVQDLERAAEYFSDADYLSALWTAREQLQSYSVSVATRGYIHSNSDIIRHDSPRRSHGWLPLHKSRYFAASKQAHENLMSARQLFKGYHWEPEVLCTELLPYISLTNPTLHDPGQISFVQEMTSFSKAALISRTNRERLNEKEIIEDNSEESEWFARDNNAQPGSSQKDDSNLSSSQTNITNVNKDDDIYNVDEDVVIEEFDDDDDFGDFVF